jgi:hypothetical protein
MHQSFTTSPQHGTIMLGFFVRPPPDDFASRFVDAFERLETALQESKLSASSASSALPVNSPRRHSSITASRVNSSTAVRRPRSTPAVIVIDKDILLNFDFLEKLY